MALCPFATHLLIAPGANDPRIVARAAILHVDAGNATSLYTYFRDRSGGIESHFFVKKDGRIEQYRDTAFQADANLDANDFAISIETQGFGAGEWTDAQLASIKRLLTWCATTHNFPLRKIQTWDGSGVGYHTQFGAPGHWTPVAKTCPGPDRVKQFDRVLVPWMTAASKPKPKPTAPQPRRVGMWNLRVGRKPAVVVAEVVNFLKTNDLDVMMICEAHQYVGPLAKALPGHGYRLVWFRGGGSTRDSAVIVRKTIRRRRKRLHRLERIGWERKPGRVGLHWPRSAVSVRVDWFRPLAAHTPPGPFGPAFPKRKAANEAAFRTIGRITQRWNKAGVPWVAGPDWNRHKDDGVSKAFLVSSAAQAAGSGIDWVASSGVVVSNVREHKVGTSDHWPKTFTVTKEHR